MDDNEVDPPGASSGGEADQSEDGDELYEEEVEFQESIEQRIREKTNLVQELEGAKVSLNIEQ